MTIGEFALIEKYFTGIGRSALIDLNIGDDCALLSPPADRQLAVSVDTLVADIHFPATADAALIAQKALRSNLSDLAAMGATPLAFTLALTLPAADETWLAAFSAGLRACADEFDIALIGGDTTRGAQHVITIQVMGLIPAGRALLRSGAHVGDTIFVTGTLGDARAALDCLSRSTANLNETEQFFLSRYYTPTPRVKFAQALHGVATAAIDISDGLSADLSHILKRSHVGAHLDVNALPLSAALLSHPRARDYALHGGDDYELCFTVDKSRRSEIFALAQQHAVTVSPVGEIVATPGLFAQIAGGGWQPLAPAGYTHF